MPQTPSPPDFLFVRNLSSYMSAQLCHTFFMSHSSTKTMKMRHIKFNLTHSHTVPLRNKSCDYHSRAGTVFPSINSAVLDNEWVKDP
jgi:hypothetical protein